MEVYMQLESLSSIGDCIGKEKDCGSYCVVNYLFSSMSSTVSLHIAQTLAQSGKQLEQYLI